MTNNPGNPTPKRLVWIADCKEDFLQFPVEVQADMGFDLHEAQMGSKSPHAKPLQGFGGAGVLEIVDNFDGNAYRAVYTVRFAGTVYVLHCFQKKSHRGISTPRAEMETVRRRLALAEAIWKELQK